MPLTRTLLRFARHTITQLCMTRHQRSDDDDDDDATTETFVRLHAIKANALSTNDTM